MADTIKIKQDVVQSIIDWIKKNKKNDLTINAILEMLKEMKETYGDLYDEEIQD